MTVVCIDDERAALADLTAMLRELSPAMCVLGFTTAEDALEYMAAESVDVIFLDVSMPEMDGLELAAHIKALEQPPHIIFVTGYSEYALDAFRLHASGYVLKPADPARLREELENLGVLDCGAAEQRIDVRCFGNFDVSINGERIRFSRSKAKELFAYLISRRGASCTAREMAAVLFEDAAYDSAQLNYLQKIVAAMRQPFEERGLDGELFSRSYNELSVAPGALNCDYYRYLKGDPAAVASYKGEFMTQYSWAEYICGYIDGLHKKREP